MTSTVQRLSPEQAALCVFEVVRANAADSERQGALTAGTLAALHGSGLFQGMRPASFGPVLPLPEVLRAVEDVARADGSAGWCLMIGAASVALTGWLDVDSAREVLDGPDVVCASVFRPSGEARPVPGGYLVSGRWSYASGVRHADWMLGGCLVPGEAPVQVFMPVVDLEVVPNWDVLGLRATGSHDVVAQDVFVPAGRTLRFQDGPRDGGALFRVPFPALLSLWSAPVPLGIARGALDELRAELGRRGVEGLGSSVWARYAEAEGMLRSARAFAHDVTGRLWEAVTAGQQVTSEDVAEAAVMARHAAVTAARVTQITHELAGGASLRSGVLSRAFRDAHAAAQHVAVAPRIWEQAGRTLLEASAPA
ncbi:hydrolase [Deinococcus sedimenti]|uniref:Acyl-CoA dehydrogenase C-terminal domain-containing protein n=1 Tax=Deinococcus sedimenti TaxID=1867090 RepID=A0ABQ2S4G3_9DEIO|nr:hydrolase [Deinococcus sedimenti]GGR91108.1 hypothetical protein GCM10008960_17720 [Deinococcus sedimenti]